MEFVKPALSMGFENVSIPPFAQDWLPTTSPMVKKNNPAGEFAGPPQARLESLQASELEAWENAWCRAFRRRTLFPREHVFCGISSLVDAVWHSLRPGLQPEQLHAAFWHDKSAEPLRVKLNSFRQFLNGQVQPESDGGLNEWYRRGRICLRLLFQGNVSAGESTSSDLIGQRIRNFFLPYPSITEALEDRDFYFAPAYFRADMPMNVREAEAEIRAMSYFRKNLPEARCRIVRVSGWQAFPIEHRLGVVTAQALASGVPTHFIVPVPPDKILSPAERSLDDFARLVRDNLPERPEAALRNMHVLKTPLSTVAAPNGRRMDYLSSSFFRWAYYCCPRALDDPELQHSLVAVRATTDPGTAFSFCPTHNEAMDFRAWFDGLLALAARNP